MQKTQLGGIKLDIKDNWVLVIRYFFKATRVQIPKNKIWPWQPIITIFTHVLCCETVNPFLRAILYVVLYFAPKLTYEVDKSTCWIYISAKDWKDDHTAHHIGTYQITTNHKIWSFHRQSVKIMYIKNFLSDMWRDA